MTSVKAFNYVSQIQANGHWALFLRLFLVVLLDHWHSCRHGNCLSKRTRVWGLYCQSQVFTVPGRPWSHQRLELKLTDVKDYPAWRGKGTEDIKKMRLENIFIWHKIIEQLMWWKRRKGFIISIWDCNRLVWDINIPQL